MITKRIYSFTPHDPLEDTERLTSLGWDMPVEEFHPARSVRGY